MEGFTAAAVYEGLCYTLTFTKEQWLLFMQHGSEFYDSEFKKIMAFLESKGKTKYGVIDIRQQLELQVVRHYRITPIASDLLDIMSEEEREKYYIDLYRSGVQIPDSPEGYAMRYYIKYLEAIIQMQQEDCDRINRSATRAVDYYLSRVDARERKIADLGVENLRLKLENRKLKYRAKAVADAKHESSE